MKLSILLYIYIWSLTGLNRFTTLWTGGAKDALGGTNIGHRGAYRILPWFSIFFYQCTFQKRSNPFNTYHQIQPTPFLHTPDSVVGHLKLNKINKRTLDFPPRPHTPFFPGLRTSLNSTTIYLVAQGKSLQANFDAFPSPHFLVWAISQYCDAASVYLIPPSLLLASSSKPPVSIFFGLPCISLLTCCLWAHLPSYMPFLT